MTSPVPHLFSSIQFFRHFREALDDVDIYPVDEKNLKIQKDMYADLANELYYDVPFAHLDRGFPESNNDFTFSCDLFGQGVAITLHNQEPFFCDYVSIDGDEKKAATKIVDILKALSNGQIFVLETRLEGQDEPRVAEVLYQAPVSTTLKPIHTYCSYQVTGEMKGEEYYTYSIRNNLSIPEVAVDLAIFRKFLPQPDKTVYQRAPFKKISPFTYEVWRELVKARADKQTEDRNIKIDKWFAKFEKKLVKWSDRQDPTLKQLYFKSVRKRHLELVLWAYGASIVAALSFSGGVTEHLLMIVCSIAIICVLLIRNITYKRYLTIALPVAYIAAVAVLCVYGLNGINGVLRWVAVVAVLVSFVECMIFDIKFLLKKQPETIK
jgi:hypothetical protein